MTTEQNEAMFDQLGKSTKESRKAEDALDAWTRSCLFGLRLKFTGMPNRGMVRRILPCTEVFTVEELERRGWPYDPGEVMTWNDNAPTAPHLYDRGAVFYEVIEDRLIREDYERRLALRRVPKYEWYSVQSLARAIKRCYRRTPLRPGQLTREQKDAGFCAIMAGLAAQIRSMAR